MKPDLRQPPVARAATKPGASARYYPRRGLSIPSVSIVDASGKIVESEQRRVFRYLAQRGRGADIIFGVGTTGEWNRLANTERQRLIQIEVDEVSAINARAVEDGRTPVEAWVGVTAPSVTETLANVECAVDARADAVVIAPLSIHDLGDVVRFFQKDVNDLFDRAGTALPVFLYDNADIAVDPRVPHIRTRDVKRLSRLPFIHGIKVSAPRRVLGNYTKGALHYKDKGEFGVYVGNAMLMFQVFKLEEGIVGRAREYWNRYLLHNELPIGIVSGPANVFPREWQRAWRACFAGDETLMPLYRAAFQRFADACRFKRGAAVVKKTIASLKHALKLEGVIDTDTVAPGTPALNDEERQVFTERYRAIRDELARIKPLWTSAPD